MKISSAVSDGRLVSGAKISSAFSDGRADGGKDTIYAADGRNKKSRLTTIGRGTSSETVVIELV